MDTKEYIGLFTNERKNTGHSRSRNIILANKNILNIINATITDRKHIRILDLFYFAYKKRSGMKKFILAVIIIGLLAVATPVHAQELLSVYYAGEKDKVWDAIQMNQDVEFTDDITRADVFVLNGDFSDVTAIHERLEQGAGLVLILGEGSQNSLSEIMELLGNPLPTEFLNDPISLDTYKGIDDPILKEIVWSTAPQVRERNITFASDYVQPIIVGYQTGQVLVGKLNIGQGNAFLLTTALDGANPQIQDWPYFNYLIYHLVERSGGRQPVSYAAYSGSPVPHKKEQVIIFICLGLMVVGSALVFLFVRRYSLRHPELLERIVVNKKLYAAHEERTDWEDIGFHRPLGGFFLAFFLGLILFVPLIIYQNLILPSFILPSAQALGIWARVTQAFTFLWTLFDMGTSVAFIKYLSEYRVHDPREGIKYGQVFVWWQALSGAVQVALVIALSSTVLPRTVYAIYVWSIIFHTIIQIPGFYQIMRHALTGLQRFDYAQLLDLGLALVFPIITQPIIVLLFVFLGKTNPVLGITVSGVMGLGVAAYAAEVLTFILGLVLYRKIGLNSGVYFYAHFDWKQIKKSFAFGSADMTGSLIWAIGQFIEVFITATYLINSVETWGNWSLAQNFVFGFTVLQALYNNLMPSISEAFSHARRALSQYYSALAYKWGGIISAFIGSVLLAVADRFILGSTEPEFHRAAVYVIPLLLWGAVQYASWVGDNVQLGSNKPWLLALMIGMEQTIRIGLLFLLIEKLQVTALIIAYFVALMIKNIVAYFINNKKCYRQKFYIWQSLAAPLLAGGIHYLLVRSLTGLIWQPNQVSSIIILFLALVPSYPIFSFLYSFFGGWEDVELAEMRRAVDLSSFMRPLAWLWWATSWLGSKVSPLHGKFSIPIRMEALREARALTREKISLVEKSSPR
jgi:O-antigen/teichoic acid export membrane protein